MTRRHIAIVVSIVLALVVSSVWLISRQSTPTRKGTAPTLGRVLYWYDPMKPDVHFDKPGKSPFMDMQLLPKYAGEGAASSGSISIDPRMVQNLGIRTARVQRGPNAREIHTVGAVAVNEKAIQVIQPRAAGWVEQMDVHAVGDAVKKGQPLAEIYAPDLLAAEHELIVASHAGIEASGKDPLVDAARNRLSLLGLTPAQIARIEQTRQAERRVALYAPFDGVVTELGVREGAQVSPGTSLFTIANLSKVWVTAQVSEAQAGWIAQGQAAVARVLAIPGRVFGGRVDYVYPELMAETRTIKARIVLDNPHLELKPGMYADVTLSGGNPQDVLLVPSEALIRTGTRTTIILADGGGRFHPVEVVAGDEANGKIAILQGLDDGEEVVTSGQFLIDSEANLRGAFSQMTAPQASGRGEQQP